MVNLGCVKIDCSKCHKPREFSALRYYTSPGGKVRALVCADCIPAKQRKRIQIDRQISAAVNRYASKREAA